jgi:streptomycin 6-kinase
MNMNTNMIFNDFLKRWNLTADGEPIITHSSQLLPVSYQGNKTMLKIALSEEERCGAKLMVWWNGEGAARVFIHDDNALLMERAMEAHSLVEKAHHGYDDEATQIICSVAAKLHSKKDNPPVLLSLKTWFKGLETAAIQNGGIFSQALIVANELLSAPQDIVVLHGDLHHGNILNFGERGWLAIDPKHIRGERGYDFANIFCNPDADIALLPGRLMRQVHVVADNARLEKTRLLQWILAYAGLSAAWSLEDGDSPDLALAIAEIAACELAR